MSEVEKIRVLHVLPWVASGGVERRRRELAEWLPDTDFEQKLFCLAEVGPLADEIRARGTEVLALDEKSVRDLSVYVELAKLIRRFRPHIIHGAVFEGVRMAVAMGRLMRVPIVISEETSHATNRSTLGHAFFGACVWASNRCVAISPAVAEYLHEHSHVPWSRIATIPNGVPIPSTSSTDTTGAIREEFSLKSDDIVFVTVGRLYDDTHKRISDIIRAMPRVTKSVPNAKLIVVGEGPIRSDLEQLALNEGVDESVVFAGYRHDVDSIYSASDCFVLASGREGFGLVVAEAMMHALPTLSTRVGGIGDIIVEGETGFAFDVGDVNELAHLMTLMATDAELRSKLGKAGRARATRDFSSQRYAGDVEALYRELMAKRFTADDSGRTRL